MNKKQRLIGVLATISLIGVAFTGAVVAVAAIQRDQATPMHPLVASVSDALGFAADAEYDDRSRALTTSEAMRKQFVSSLVDEGVIGEDEADEFDEWLEDAPEAFRSESSADHDGSGSLDDFLIERFSFGEESEDVDEWLGAFLERVWEEEEEIEGVEEKSGGERVVRPFAERREFERRFDSFDDLPFGRFEFEGSDHADWLDELVEQGVMSREEADILESWFEDLPGAFGEGLRGFPGERDFEFDSDDGRFRFRGQWRFGEDEDVEPSHSDDDDNGDA